MFTGTPVAIQTSRQICNVIVSFNRYGEWLTLRFLSGGGTGGGGGELSHQVVIDTFKVEIQIRDYAKINQVLHSLR